MGVVYQSNLEEKAIDILINASSGHGIMASSQKKDNYGNIWARDTAVASLSILAYELVELYPVLKNSLLLLQQSALKNGQIPSNIKIDDTGAVTAVSFGGPVGRVDTSFWWIISSVFYMRESGDAELKELVKQQCEKIFELAESWEFNNKDLMYVPMSSNWADEYVTHGYVLYDQVLRYWALDMAGRFFKEHHWTNKAQKVKTAIKKHFLLEGELDDSVYTKSQQASLLGFDLRERFIASFSPGDRIERYDMWSIGLLLLLDIPTKSSVFKINEALVSIFNKANRLGMPAFWPLINEHDPLYQSLLLNHSYNFKNKPGHFHNGGIWPVVNGFLIAGLHIADLAETAELLVDALEQRLSDAIDENPFAEYFDAKAGRAGGVDYLCFSASGYLLATLSAKYKNWFKSNLLDIDNELAGMVANAARNIIAGLNLSKKQVTAISIAGESGCGKSTLSAQLRKSLTEMGYHVILLHQDEYFKLPPQKNHEARINDFSWIGPQEVRLDLLDEHIAIIKHHTESTIAIPRMDWLTDVEKADVIDISLADLVIVDGTYTSLLKNVDYKIFINTDYKQTHVNRLKRNRETVTHFIERVLEKESNIISQHEELADIVLDDKFNEVKNHVVK